jgi:hypothetical protein
MWHPLIRSFRDDLGREWEVRAIEEPTSEGRWRLLPTPRCSLGWLQFAAGDDERRLAPIPPGWYVASDELLTQWCAAAVSATAENGARPPHPQ